MTILQLSNGSGSRSQATVQQAFRRKDYMTGCPRNNGYFGSTKACDEFFLCVNGTAYRLYCDRGFQWSGEERTCVTKYESDCG
jgi:hypothetical protein